MRRIEPILNALANPRYKYYWWADGSNGYWCVLMYRPHAFRTTFSRVFGQLCYLRMGQGLSGAPDTYARVKDIASWPVPGPNSVDAISGISERVSSVFGSFFDDDIGCNDDCPSPTNEDELERFIYLTVYLRFIPGRAELIRIMKLTILTEINWTEREEQTIRNDQQN
jgi:hypothetical protein